MENSDVITAAILIAPVIIAFSLAAIASIISDVKEGREIKARGNTSKYK